MRLSTPATAAADLVPLAERVRYMWLFRLFAGALVLAAWIALPAFSDVRVPDVAAGTGLYLAVGGAVEAVVRAVGRATRRLFGALLMLDGVYLAVVPRVRGVDGPLGYLMLVHLLWCHADLVPDRRQGSRSGTPCCCS